MTEPRELPATRTRPDAYEVARLLHEEMPHISLRGISILLGQILVETGGLKACWCWNLGNVKSRHGDGRSWTHFECGEELRVEVANEQRAKFPDLVTFVGAPYLRDGKRMQSCRLKPRHEYSRFRAFESLQAAVLDHCRLLELPRYRQAMESVDAGNPEAAVRAFYAGEYFTGSLSAYIDGVKRESTRAVGIMSGRPTIRAGATGPWVSRWQQSLGINETGVMDAQTVRATEAWQRGAKLLTDGIVGPMSWGTMMLQHGEPVAWRGDLP